jgi:hypothetical protein
MTVTSGDERRAVEQAPRHLLVGGAWPDTASGGRFSAAATLDAATAGQPEWAAWPAAPGGPCPPAFEEMFRRGPAS